MLGTKNLRSDPFTKSVTGDETENLVYNSNNNNNNNVVITTDI